jgi:hypothetical protein
MSIYLSLLVCIVGALVYLFCGPYPQPQPAPWNVRYGAGELGRLAFACGLLAFLIMRTGQALNLIK